MRRTAKKQPNLAAWLDLGAIGAWGILFLKLWLADQLFLLIHPNYKPLVIVAGFGLLGMAIALGLQSKPPTPHQNSSLARSTSLLLITTAILGMVISPRPFSSDTAIHRGVIDQINAVSSVQSFRANAKSEERSLLEWIRTLNVYPEPDAYQGQKAKVQGFVVHPPDFPPQFFLLTRFVITCCAADVYPVSLPVKLAEGKATDFPSDRWFEVTGEMVTETITNRRQLAIAARQLTPIPEPRNPYES
ncbi:MAG: TIGR03943 family protein [Pseudanabaenaceae cyanobacterium bins.68]|nr:TIGR03943 family protein [Pseudanabaenaceae cyanobacterium bins.68]